MKNNAIYIIGAIRLHMLKITKTKWQEQNSLDFKSFASVLAKQSGENKHLGYLSIIYFSNKYPTVNNLERPSLLL